jgi:hypothetical protein
VLGRREAKGKARTEAADDKRQSIRISQAVTCCPSISFVA